MVDLDDVKPKIFAKVKYPSLTELRENPSAPPIVNGGADDRGNGFRLKHIRELQNFLEEEIKKREALNKKYFRISKIINILNNGLSSVIIAAGGTGGALLLTGIGSPISAALAIGGVVIGGVTIIGNFYSRKARTKGEKHLKISERAITKLDTIASHISKSLMDDFVSNEEFNIILEEVNKYKVLKEEIRNNNKKKLKNEEKESLIEKGRQEATNSFRKLIEKNNKFETL